MTAPAINTADVLTRLPLFRELAPEQIAALAAATRERRAARGELLFHRGDAPRGFFVVLSGQIKLGFASAQGNEKVVEIIGPQQTFGEAVMFLERPYPVFAEALQDSLLLHIGSDAVFRLLDDDRLFARKLLAGLSLRLHALIQDVETYSLRSSAQRVVGYLLECAAQQRERTPGAETRIALPASKQVIASRLNLTPETLSRVFHDLSAHGLIEVSGKHITILDARRLAQF